MPVTETSNTLASPVNLTGEYTSSATAAGGAAREGARLIGYGTTFGLRRVSEIPGAGTQFDAGIADIPAIIAAVERVRDDEVASAAPQVLALGINNSRIEYIPGSDRLDLVDSNSTESWAPASGEGGGFAVVLEALEAAKLAAAL